MSILLFLLTTVLLNPQLRPQGDPTPPDAVSRPELTKPGDTDAEQRATPGADVAGAADAAADDEPPLVVIQQVLTHPDPKVDALLTALETADEDLDTLSGQVLYLRHDAVLDDRQFRWGTLRFASIGDQPGGAPPLRVFRADFDRYFDGVGMREEVQSWVFDGRWLIEQDFADKRFRKVEIAGAGSGFDPMKLGEGPLAIPIGQKKQEILARFYVEERPVWEGIEPPNRGDERDWDRNFRANVMGDAETVQLRLVPRHEGVSEFDEVRLWYIRGDAKSASGVVDEDRWVPRLVRTTQFDEHGGVLDQATVQLSGVVINDPRDISAVVIDEPDAEDGWRITVDRLPAPVGRESQGGAR